MRARRCCGRGGVVAWRHLTVVIPRSQFMCVRRQVRRDDTNGGVVDAELHDDAPLVAEYATHPRLGIRRLHCVHHRPPAAAGGLDPLFPSVNGEPLLPQYHLPTVRIGPEADALS